MLDDLLVDLDHVRAFVVEIGSLTPLDYFSFMLGLVFIEPLVPCLSLVSVLLWDFRCTFYFNVYFEVLADKFALAQAFIMEDVQLLFINTVH